MSTKEANQQLNEENISVTSKKETVCIIGISLLFVFCSLFFQDFSQDHYSDYIVFAYSIILLSLKEEITLEIFCFISSELILMLEKSIFTLNFLPLTSDVNI